MGGGDFVARAAAFEKRIRKFVCFDIFYSPMDALRLQTNRLEFRLLQLALFMKQRFLINQVIKWKAKHDLELTWMVQQGQNNTGTQTPYDFLKAVQSHTVESILERITQPCLLMVGTHDHYVPSYRLMDMKKRLTHAEQVEAHLFTPETGGVLHCQIDQIEVGMAVIRDFLEE